MAAILKSFEELGQFFGIDRTATTKKNKKNGKGKANKAKPRICKLCGAELRPIKGTNCWVCDGTRIIKDEETGEKRKVPCTHKVLSRRINEEVPA